jgi:hypothetical protein
MGKGSAELLSLLRRGAADDPWTVIEPAARAEDVREPADLPAAQARVRYEASRDSHRLTWCGWVAIAAEDSFAEVSFPARPVRSGVRWWGRTPPEIMEDGRVPVSVVRAQR